MAIRVTKAWQSWKAVLLFAGGILFAAHAQAAESPSGSGIFFPPQSMVDHTFEVAPRVTDVGFRGNFVVVNHDSDTWVVQQRLGQFEASGSPTIAQTAYRIPDSLWDVELGGGYRHRMGDRREIGLDLSVGSASDKLFNSTRETVIRASVDYKIPSRATNAWVFLLAYSNNRSFANNIPFPGVAYLYHTQKLDALIGLPYLSLSYRPDLRWSGHASVFGPTHVSADWGYQAWKPIRIFAGYAWGQEEWQPADRPDANQRLFFDQKKWILGTQTRIFKIILLELDGAYDFDRRFYLNRRAVNSGVTDSELQPGWAFEGRLTVRL